MIKKLKLTHLPHLFQARILPNMAVGALRIEGWITGKTSFIINLMPASKKLRIKLPSDSEARDVCSIEEARYRFNWGREPFVVIAEGEFVPCFDDLTKLAGEDRFKDREFLDVEIQPLLAGG
jgi:hypothetical protein